MKKVIKTENAPAAIGAYSQGIMANNFLFTSGQLPIDPKTGKILKGDVEAQTKQCMENIEAILQEEEMSFNNVLKVTIFITNITNFAAVNKVYAAFFKENYPARSCFEISKLPNKDALIEIEVIACK